MTDPPRHVRPGYTALSPALTVKDAPRALDFYRDAFDAVEVYRMTNPDGSELTFSVYDVQKGVDIPKATFYLNINDYNQTQPPNF